MPDALRPQPLERLLGWILSELETSDSVFGIHRSLFYAPRPDALYATARQFGQFLATPIGPAAGPHTQLAPNIVCAWLAGGRFIELKTVQVMDELEIPRPCIDMADEGYNVEWSQELRLEQSAQEYIKAWALIHILHRLLGLEGRVPVGTIFNMSVGYNLEGIRSAPMARFMDRLADASAELEEIRTLLATRFRPFASVEIPPQLTNSVTLSTMHGCPPDEIERIATYLLAERGLHTTIKLNPTLLGKEAVLDILHGRLGFREIEIPDRVFEHDLSYPRAVELIRSLKSVAAAQGLAFGVKLSNTLAIANHRGVFAGDEMYMSGRALYPVTLSLFHKLAREFAGDLNVSYSAGADALNLPTLLACGARPVTVASDLLKPGGYARLGQYLEILEAEMHTRGATSLEELARDRYTNLERAVAEALATPRYRKSYFPYGLPKVDSGLGLFDCITAPCSEACPVCQDVPEYARLIAQGRYDQALAGILRHNPLPGVTGHICTHICQTRCTRNNYDQPVAIRALKRFACERGHSAHIPSSAERAPTPAVPETSSRVAVVGGGPSGLAAAYYLALSGVSVTIFEGRNHPGGMPALAPHFRLPPAAIGADIERIMSLGVEIRLSHPVTGPPERLLAQGFAAVYLASGFPRDASLDIAGIDACGVHSALGFLEQVAKGKAPTLGERVLIIGGGNTAIDTARTAQRLTGRPVTVVYRRTRAEMPADEDESQELLAEGNRLLELASPTRVIVRNGRVAALECVQNVLGEPDADGRRVPVPIAGSEFQTPADTLILAVGQASDTAFLEGSLRLRRDGSVVVDPASGRAAEHIYAGGDLVRGPSTVVAACADGRRAAEAICRQLGIPFAPLPVSPAAPSADDLTQTRQARARIEPQHTPPSLRLARRNGFDLVEGSLSAEAAHAEALRCLQCSVLCDKCVEVCPNRANCAYRIVPVRWRLPLLSCRNDRLAAEGEETFAVSQERQILHIDDFCNECGNCVTFCVHQGKPYLDKPRLFLRHVDFEQEQDNAFHIEGDTLRRREGGRESQLALNGSRFAFENAHVRIRLGRDFAIQEMALKQPFSGPFSLHQAAEMALLLQGIRSFLPHLLG